MKYMNKLHWVCKKHNKGSYFPDLDLNWCQECHDKYVKEKIEKMYCRCGACGLTHPDDNILSKKEVKE